MEGHAFLGSAMRGAHLDGASLIQFLKPLLVGQDPLDRERLYQACGQRNRQTTIRRIGAVDVALWDLAGKVAGLPIHRLLGSLPRLGAGLRQLGGLESTPGLRARRRPASRPTGWAAYKIHPPTDPAVDRESAGRCGRPWATATP